MSTRPPNAGQVAALEPIDDLLMGEIQADLQSDDQRIINLENGTALGEANDCPVVYNGSFMLDSANTFGGTVGVPLRWSYQAGPSGSLAIDQPADFQGSNAAKFTTVGGGGSNAAGTLTSTNLIPVSPGKSYFVKFMMKCSATNITGNTVKARVYDKTGAELTGSKQTIFSLSTNAPTSGRWFSGKLVVPTSVGACFIALELAGGGDGSPAGNTWFSGVQFYVPTLKGGSTIIKSGSGTWFPPFGVTAFEVEAWGAGSNHATRTGDNHILGGGAGGYTRKFYTYIDHNNGFAYTFNPSSGENTQFGALTARRATDATTSAVGTGGTASGGDENITGADGNISPTANGMATRAFAHKAPEGFRGSGSTADRPRDGGYIVIRY